MVGRLMVIISTVINTIVSGEVIPNSVMLDADGNFMLFADGDNAEYV